MIITPRMSAWSPPAGDAARALLLLAVGVSLPITAAAQTLPYIPTTIFLPAPKPGSTGDNSTKSIAYVFTPHENSVDLLALNTSATLVASSLSFNTLSSNLPFLENNSTAFVPSLADNGSLIVYAGNCSTTSASGIWSFDPSPPDGISQWDQGAIAQAADTTWIQMGPSFLGAGFTFSTTLGPEVSPVNTFIYGGMCPNQSIADPTSSQSDATYSNQMLKISQSAAGSGDYTIEPVDSDGPPIPEAGFTFTGLAPSFSNRSGTVTQQRDYVLLGGHTQYAFINMSTVAIWSLPQETWGFVSDIRVMGSGSASTELAPMENVDSRSGHSAVLSEDGTALVVLGGWVGDLTQAASPQLAVLQIGWDHGGEGEWRWTIPESQPPGNGIYGHGATLLPGNVMMVYGGYTISPSGSNNKRQAGGSTAYFLNLTSMAWLDEYTNPSYTETPTNGSTPGRNSTQTQTLAIGLGLGLGLGFILIAIVTLVCKRRRKRTSRNAAIRALSQDNSRFIGHAELPGDNDNDANLYMSGPDSYRRGDRSRGYQSLQTSRASMENSRQNWFGDMAPAPLPMLQINRKPVAPRAARGQHQPASSAAYEPVSSPRGLGSMNPIFEADEDDDEAGDIGDEAMSPARDGRRDSGAYSDPFVTPTRERPISFPPPSRSSQTPSPEERNRASTTDPEVQDWMTDVDAADALLSRRASASRTAAAVGRSSSRRGHNATSEEEGSRTDSNISESNHSNLSRSGSILRHLRPVIGDAAATALTATPEGREGSSGSSSTPTYNTAKSSFTALQAEGPGLLLGRDRQREDVEDDPLQEPGSPSKNKPFRRSWLGSLRRVFTGPTPSPSSSGNMGEDGQVQDGVVEANGFEPRPGGLGGIGGIAADVLSRRKSGRRAWESHEAGPSQAGTSYAPLDGKKGDGEHSDDEEWDIEKAVEKRLVQFMFTVPKEPLRVVNAEPDFESERDVMLAGPEKHDDEREHEEQQWTSDERGALPREATGRLESGLPPALTISPVSGDNQDSGLSNVQIKPSTEALRRELDAEWERIEAEEAILEAPEPLRLRIPSDVPRPLSQLSQRHAREYGIPQLPPLLHHNPHTSRPSLPSTILTIEEQINLLGAELHQVRSATQTPMSQISHISDADVLSAEIVRFQRPSGIASTLQITPALTGSRAFRSGGRPRDGDDVRKSTDLRSESNLRAANELRRSGNNTPVRRVRAMVEEFESKSSREASPSGSPVKNSPRGSSAKGR